MGGRDPVRGDEADRELGRWMAEIRLRASKQIGDLVRDLEKAQGVRELPVTGWQEVQGASNPRCWPKPRHRPQ